MVLRRNQTPKEVYPDRVNRWDVLLTNGREHLDQLPYIAEDLERLQFLFSEARIVLSLGDSLRSQLLGNTARLRQIVNEGENLRSRLGANLQAKFGFTSEKLVNFGFKPRAINRRRKVEKPTLEGSGREEVQAGGKERE